MGLIQSWSDFIEDAGEASGNFQKKALSTAKDAVCNLYSKYPRNLPINPYSRGMMTSLCTGTNDPKGIIASGAYLVYLNYRYFPRFATEPTEFRRFFVGGNALGAEALASLNPDTNTDNQSVVTTAIGVEGTEYIYPNFLNTGSGSEIEDSSLQYEVVFVPNDNPPLPVAPEDVTYNTNVSYDNGDVLVTENYDVNVTYEGDRFDFPITVNIGGQDFTLDNDGVSVPTAQDDTAVELPDNLPTVKPPLNETNYNVTFPTPSGEEEEQGEVEVEDTEIDWVLIDITTEPSGGKILRHKDPSDNTYFAGYFSWLMVETGKYRLEEFPIRKSQTAFRAPENIGGYRVYAVNDAKLTVRQYVQKVEEE